MSKSRQLRLGAFMRPVSIHTAAWRYPGSMPDANFNFDHIKRFAQTLERLKSVIAHALRRRFLRQICEQCSRR